MAVIEGPKGVFVVESFTDKRGVDFSVLRGEPARFLRDSFACGTRHNTVTIAAERAQSVLRNNFPRYPVFLTPLLSHQRRG